MMINVHLQDLESMTYPGRVIILGKDPSDQHVVVVYAITGRSPSSQARKIEFEQNCAWVKPTDEEILKKGDPDLLIYPAICIGTGIAVSNGKQTLDVKAHMQRSLTPVQVLEASLQDWEYEPDAPNYTPRISGCLLDMDRGALSILKRAEDGRTHRQYFEFPLIPGDGHMIATYSGDNSAPLPSFVGEPRLVQLTGRTPQEVAACVYNALAPEEPEQDFRVSTVCLFAGELEPEATKSAVINRQDKE